MTTLTLLSSLLLSFSASFAHAEPLDNPCSLMACAGATGEIAAEYRAAGGIELGELPLLASGECYHSSPQHDPNRQQFGYLLLDRKDDLPYQSGTFSFFEKGNSYASLTLEEARALQPTRFAKHRQMDLQPDYAFTDMNRDNPETPWMYWLKQTADKLYVVGVWGPRHRFICRMNKHLEN